MTYPCPGSPALARRVVELLKANGIDATLETKRMLYHGAFLPLMLMYPEGSKPGLAGMILRSFLSLCYLIHCGWLNGSFIVSFHSLFTEK